LKKLFSHYLTLLTLSKSVLKRYPYWVSSSVLLLSGLLLLNLSFGQTNGIENNLQPMPSVSVDLNGKSNVSYQIEVPEGTKGAHPNLSIHYNSSGGYGNMGVGWNLSGVHWITRDATYGIDYSANDQFTSTLGGALVKRGDGNYYSRKETFMKFVPKNGQEQTTDTWYGYDKSGTIYTFTLLKGTYGVGAVWFLTDVRDIYGNGYSISYPTNAIIFTYADRTVTVNFTPRSNIISSYTINTPYPTNSIVSSISIKASSNLTRTYTLSYGKDFFGNERLDSIVKEETINGTKITYTPIGISYSQTTSPSFTSNGEFSNPNSYPVMNVPLNDKTECVNGGLICQKAGVACPTAPPSLKLKCETQKKADQLQCNAYTISWFIPCTSGIKIPMAMTTVGDIQGDGKQEIIELNGSADANDLHLEATTYNGSNFVKSRVSPNLPNIQYKTFSSMGFGDVNGDGKTDLAYLDGTALKVAFSNGNSFDLPITYANVTASSYGGTNWLLDKPDYQWKGSLIDINGDARADYVAPKSPSQLAIYLWNGSGFDNERVISVDQIYMDQGDGQDSGQFMDINSDGKPEYVFLNKLNSSITAYFFPAGLSGTATKKDYPVSDINDPRNRWFSDINADGKIDFVIQKSDGTVYVSYFDGVIYSNPPTSIPIAFNAPYSTNASPVKKFFADVNGDSYPDFVRYVDGSIRVSYGGGSDFKNGGDSGSSGFSIVAKGFWNMIDLNGDGKPDIVSIKETESSNPLASAILSEPASKYKDVLSNNLQHKIDIHMNQVQNATIAATLVGGPILGAIVHEVGSMWSTPKMSPVALLGALQILASSPQPSISQESKIEVYFQNPRTKENQITQIDGGYGRIIGISYDDAKNFPNAVLSNGAYPSLPNLSAGQLVKSVTSNIAGAMVNTDTYSYSDNRIWMGKPDQIAGLGFRTRTITSSLSGDTHFERYIQSSNALAGMSDYNETKNAIGQYKQFTNIGYTTSYPLGPVQEWTTVSSTSQTTYRDGIALITTVENYAYDSYGNVTTKTTSAAGSVVTESDSYMYDTTNWILNRPLQSTKDIDGAVVENTQYAYNGNTGVAVTSMAGTVAAATSNVTLDGNGNQQSVSDALGRTTSYQYDSVVHNYVTKITNPTNLTITKTYDTSLGLELTAQDANGGVITKRYDNKGRLSEIIPPGENSYVERYAYVDYLPSSPTLLPGGEGSYFKSVTKAIVNPDGGETTASEYFDVLGRSVRKESPGVGNNVIVETTEYDSKGQVTRKSNPYLENVETPVYTLYTYNPYEGYVTKVNHPDGGYTIPTYNGFNESTQTYAVDASLIGSQDLIKNAKGQVLTRTVDGKSLNYKYDKAGRVTDILDPENGVTTTVYDNAGRKTSVSDVNSGTTSYTYDAVGNIQTQTDARGITTTFVYDSLNRPKSVSYSNGEGNTVLTYDEGGQAKYALGRLTSVVDDAGKLELGYDIKGNRIYQRRTIDDLVVLFKRTYDLQSRLASTTYPDGTKVYQKYASTGHFSGITMDTADGSSKGYTVGSYTGPVIENGQFKIIRETGNGVKMEIQYDPIKRRPIGLVTKLANGNIESATSYTYDQKSNITQIADTIVNGRTQDFVYDAQNRLTQASGKYGVENYTYTDNGNLTKRGQFTLSYGDANHKHAVTAVTSPNTGTFNYAYDESGNMVSRNGDTMSYNAQGKLKQIDTVGGDKLEYLYESTGNRIRRKMKASGVVVYSFDGLYEITRTPGQAESHTLYFKGLYGDVFSQMTRSDATLVASSFSGSKSSNSLDVVKSTGIFSFAKGDAFPPNSFVKGFFCEDIAGSCSDYYVNTAKYYYVRSAFRVVGIINTVEYDVFVWMMLVVVLYLVYIQSRRHRRDVARYVSTMIYAKRTLSVTPLLIVSILFTFTQCGLVSGGGKKGEAPWILLASGISNDTASVDDVATGNTVTPSSPNAPIGSIPPSISGNNTNGSGGYRPSGAGGYNGGSGGAALVPVTGMYFLHPDHLGSITMITDGRGNVIAGGNNGGKSHISYTPYGGIHRTDSSGPDITRFKYTGQEEDKESGLLYYKARYYDPMVGRFLQADNLYQPDDTAGMNHYMYVNGSPMNFRDESGNSCSKNIFSAIGGALGAAFGGPIGYAIGSAVAGVAPGTNYTGVGHCGGEPREVVALWILFSEKNLNIDPVKAIVLLRYYQMQNMKGEPTILDGLNTNRKLYTGFLIGLAFTHQIEDRTAFLAYYFMTNDVRQPTNGIDRGSYNHDYSDGSTPLYHKAKASNNRWVSNAWSNIHNPYDLALAVTGTILFKSANLIGDAASVKASKYNGLTPNQWHFSAKRFKP
jgi:RHS repeat-associated protein